MRTPTSHAPTAPQRPLALVAHLLIDEAYLAFHAEPTELSLTRLVALSEMAVALRALHLCELPGSVGGVQ